MIEQNAKADLKMQRMLRHIIILFCICAAAALIHAQASDHLARPTSHKGIKGEEFCTGWPFVSTFVFRAPGDPDGSVRLVHTGWFLLNLLICVMLLSVITAGLAPLFSPRRPVWQFTLSDLFVCVTAVGIVVFLFVWDSNSQPIGSKYPFFGDGDYLALATFPAYDQLLIWSGVFCAVLTGLRMAHRIALLGANNLHRSRREDAQ